MVVNVTFHCGNKERARGISSTVMLSVYMVRHSVNTKQIMLIVFRIRLCNKVIVYKSHCVTGHVNGVNLLSG